MKQNTLSRGDGGRDRVEDGWQAGGVVHDDRGDRQTHPGDVAGVVEAGDEGVEESAGDSSQHEVVPQPLETEAGGGDVEVGERGLGPRGLCPLEADGGVLVLSGGERGEGGPAQGVEADQDLGQDLGCGLRPLAGDRHGVTQLPVPVLLCHSSVASAISISI